MESINKDILGFILFTIVLFLMSYIIPRYDKKISGIAEEELIIRTKLSNRRDAFIRYKFSEQDVHIDSKTIKILESISQNKKTEEHINELIRDIRGIKVAQLGYLHEITTGEPPRHETEFRKWGEMSDSEIFVEFNNLFEKIPDAYGELKRKLRQLMTEKHLQENRRWLMIRVTALFQLLGVIFVYLL